MIWKTASLLSAIISAALLGVSCSSEAAKAGKVSAQAPAFEVIKDCNLLLEVVTPETEYFRGDVAPSITFRLRNAGLKPVTVFEWMAKEQDNVKIHYAKCDGSLDRIPQSEWKIYEPKLKDPVIRVPLDLYPRNTALINVDLSFIKESPATATPTGRVSYVVVGELNLKSVSAKGKPFIVTFK